MEVSTEIFYGSFLYNFYVEVFYGSFQKSDDIFYRSFLRKFFTKVFYGSFQRNDDVRKRHKKPKDLVHNSLFLLNHICTPYLKTDTGNLLILFSVMGSKTRFHKKLYGHFQRNDDVRKKG